MSRTYYVDFAMTQRGKEGRIYSCRGAVEYNAREWDSYESKQQVDGLLEFAKSIATRRYPEVDWTGAQFIVETAGYRGDDVPVITDLGAAIDSFADLNRDALDEIELGSRVMASINELENTAVYTAEPEPVAAWEAEGGASAAEEPEEVAQDEEWGPNPYAVAEEPTSGLRSELAGLYEDLAWMSNRIERIRSLILDELNSGATGASS